MNIVKLQNDLKDLSDQQLLSSMQMGSAPQYLVLAEMQRRKKMRDEASTQAPQNEGTVADEIMGGITQLPMQAPQMASGGLVSFAQGGYAKGEAEACWTNPETGEKMCPSSKPDVRKPTVKKMQQGGTTGGDGVLRLLPADPVADAYTYLQSRGAEIPADMSEQGIIDYANRVRALDENEVTDAGVRVPAEAAPAQITPFGAPRVDYGSGGRGEVMPETSIDAAPTMPMGGGEYAPGFEMQAPAQEGLPGLLAPEGPAPERAVPFLGQMMEAVVPSAQAAETAPSYSAEEGLQRMFAAEKAAAANEPPVQAPMAEPTWYEEVGDWIYENPTEAAITALSLVPVVGAGGRLIYVTSKAAPKFFQQGWRAAEKGFRQRYAQKGVNKGKEAIEEGAKTTGKPYKSKEWAENEAKRRGGAAMKDPKGEGWIVVPKMSEAAKGFATSGEGAGITAGLGLTASSLVGDDEEVPPAPASTTTPAPSTVTEPDAPPAPPTDTKEAKDTSGVRGLEQYLAELQERKKGASERDTANEALMRMGLAMMASKNPDFLGALGEGGIEGLKAYGEARKSQAETIQDILKEEGDIYAAQAMAGVRQGALNVDIFEAANKALEGTFGSPNWQMVKRLQLKKQGMSDTQADAEIRRIFNEELARQAALARSGAAGAYSAPATQGVAGTFLGFE